MTEHEHTQADSTSFPDAITAEASRLIAAAPGRVWDALTNLETLKTFFLGATVETDWKIGHPIRFHGSFKGKAYEDNGRILQFEPERRLSFTHWSALSGKPESPENTQVVTFELEPERGQTRATIKQANLRGNVKPSDVQHRQEYEKNWRSVLEGLAKAAEL